MMVETNPVAHSRRDKTRSEFKRSLQQNLLLKTSDLKYCKTLTTYIANCKNFKMFFFVNY